MTKEEILSAIRAGKVFIYPTDTIYGLGCDATNPIAVQRIREIKKREEKPFLVIAPSLEWIFQNCIVTEEQKKIILEKLPGPYAFFLKRKNEDCVAENVNIEKDTLGVRLIDHPLQKIITEFGGPFITTSVNIAGEPNATSLEDIPEDIKSKVDHIIYEGVKDGPPSTRINFI